MYTCVNNGCPEEGATAMECKPGFTGPLCALCSDGYFKSIRDCARCENARIGELVGSVLGMGALIMLVVFFARKYRRYLHHASAFSRELSLNHFCV
jgi:hypothetical protein